MGNGQNPTVDPAAAQDTIKALERIAAMLANVAAATERTTDATNELERALEDGSRNNERRAREQEEELERREKQWKALQKQAAGLTTLSDAYGVAKDAVKLYIEQNKRLSKAVLHAVTAFKGLVAGAKMTAAALKGIFSIGGSLVSMFFDIGAAIVSIPFKFFNHIFGKAKELMSSGTELAQAYEDVRKVFGNTGSGLGKSVIDLGKNLTKGLITPGLSARRVFGDMAEAIKYANEVASASPEAFQAVSDQFSGRNGLEILAMAKGLGIANEELVGFMDSAIATGQPMETMLTDVTKYAKGMGDAFGLNSKMISRSMAKAAKDVKHFANSSVKEIAQATVYAQKLGVSLESITGILDAFNTFESAAENVSKLSQAFGVNLDAMKLLEAKTPDEALDQIKQAFTAAGKSADQMNRQELQLIASTVGMDEATVRKTLSMKNAGASMQNIKSTSSSLEMQTLNTSQALEKLSKDIEKIVKAGEAPKGENFFEVFMEGFVEGVDKSQKMRKLYMDTAKAIQMVRMEGRLLGDFFVKAFPGFSEFITGLTEKMHDIPLLFRDIRKSLEVFIKGLESGSSSFESLIESVKKNIIDFMGGDNSKMTKGLTRMWNAAQKILSQGIDWLTDRLREGLDAIVSFLKNPIDDQMGVAGGLLGDVQKQIDPITKSLKRMWTKLKDPLVDLLKEAFKEAIAMMWEGIKALPWQAWLVLVGPSLIGGLGNVIAGAIARSLMSKAVASAAASALGGVGAGGAGAGAAAGGSAALAAAPYVAAAAAWAAAAWQASELIDELQQDMKREIAFKADTALRETEASSKVLKNFVSQREVLKEKYRLGQLTVKQYNEETKALEGQLSVAREQLKVKLQASTESVMGGGASTSAQAVDMLAMATKGAALLPGGFAPAFAADYLKGKFGTAAETDIKLQQTFRMMNEASAASGEHQLAAADALEAESQKLFKSVGAGSYAAINKVMDKARKDVTLMNNMGGRTLKELDELDLAELSGLGEQERVYLSMWAESENLRRSGRRRVRDEGQAKAAAAATEAAPAAEGESTSIDELGLSATSTTEEITVKLKEVDELSKKILSKDFDLKKTMEDVRAKLKDVKFNLFDEKDKDAKMKEIDESSKMLTKIHKIPVIFSNLSEALGAAAHAIDNLGEAKNASSVLGRFLLGVRKLATFFNIDTAGMFFSKMSSLNKSVAASQVMASETVKNAEPLKTSISSLAGQFDSMKDSFETMQKFPVAVTSLATSLDEKFFSNLEAFGLLMGPADQEFSLGSRLSNVGDLSGIEVSVASWLTDVEMVLNSLEGWTKSEGFQNLNGVTEKVIAAEGMIGRLYNAMSLIEGSVFGFAEIQIADKVGVVKDTITHVVDAVNLINKGLSKIDIGEKDVKVKLGEAANGIVKKAFDPVRSASTTINLTLNVHMSARDIESNLVRSSDSKIRLAINEALASQNRQMLESGSTADK